MSANIHLLLLLSTVLAIGVTLLMDWGPRNRRVAKVLRGSLPVLLVGLACSLLMIAGEKPLLEWVVPLSGVVLIGWLCKSDRVFRSAVMMAPVVAVVLVIHFLNVAHQQGITNAPEVLAQISKQRESIAKKNLSEQLLHTFNSDEEFPAGPISTILTADNSQGDIVEVKRAYPEWHTALSRLYRVESRDGTVWYPGGKVGDASGQLEVRVQP